MQWTDANGKIQTFFVDKAGRIVIGVGSMIPKHFSSKDGKGSAQLHSELGTWINVTVEAGATQMTLRAGKGATSKAIIWTRVEYVRGELAMERPNWGLVA